MFVFDFTFDQVDAYAKFIRATPDETGEQFNGGQKKIGPGFIQSICRIYPTRILDEVIAYAELIRWTFDETEIYAEHIPEI